jgi:alanine dehydrogenase
MRDIKVIGIPKEIKSNERRVSLIPKDVKEIVSLNINVIIETNAGLGAGYKDDDYIEVGAVIFKTAKEIYDNSDMIVKVKEPQIDEYDMIKEGQIIFTFFHFASSIRLVEAMIKSKATCIAYEMIRKDNGIYPILAPMSKIAGEQAIIYAYNNTKGEDNKEKDTITIIGLGNVGKASAIKARELGYKKIILMDIDNKRLEEFNDSNNNYYDISINKMEDIMRKSRIIVGSIYNFGSKASRLITDRLMEYVMEECLIMDVAIDQGGITSQSSIRTIEDPIINYKNVKIYCVPNIPSQVPIDASRELSNVVIGYIKRIINKEIDDEIEGGIYMINGKLR